LGRAIIRRPKAFLLDEPIGTLDAKFREEMRVELKRLHVDIEATTVYVTHDQVEAMSMGDRIAVMKLGIMQQIGTPNEIYNTPKNLFVANFIGSPGMNLINCKAIKKNGEVSLFIDSVKQNIQVNRKLEDKILDKDYLDKDLVLGVRPEEIFLSLESKSSFIKTEVFISEYTGSYNIIDIYLGDSEPLRVRTLPSVEPNIGDTVYIGFDMDRISLFDKTTEDSIL